jgi:hypothetical protein
MFHFTRDIYLMGSLPIAKKVEQLYPEPSLNLDEPQYDEVMKHILELEMRLSLAGIMRYIVISSIQ